MKIKHIFCAFLISGCLLQNFAQTLSLDSCQQLVLQNNAMMKNAQLDVLVAQQVKNQVLTKFFPNISAMAGGYHALNPLIEYGIKDVNNAEARQMLYNAYAEYGAAIGLPNSISMCENGLVVGATAIQPVFMGGQIVNGNRLAKVGVQAAELQSQLTREELLQQTEESYWLVVSLYEKKKTLEQALIFLDTLYRDVTTAHNAGLVTQNEELKVVLKQNELKSNLLQVNNGIVLSSMALCQMVGIDYDENLRLSDTLNDNIIKDIQSCDATTAVSHRKETQLLDIQVKAEELKKKMTIGESLPQVLVGLGASYGNLVFDRNKFNGIAFATLQIPLTNWWESSYKIKQQNLMIQKAENQKNDLTQKMMLETRQAWNNAVEAAEQIQLMRNTVTNAKVNLNTSSVNYKAGLTPISDLLEAQTLYRQSQDQYTDALISYKLKLAHYHTLTAQ